jgi:hypothetical protein
VTGLPARKSECAGHGLEYKRLCLSVRSEQYLIKLDRGAWTDHQQRLINKFKLGIAGFVGLDHFVLRNARAHGEHALRSGLLGSHFGLDADRRTHGFGKNRIMTEDCCRKNT